MSDVNVIISSVDKAMDIMDAFSSDLSDIRANITCLLNDNIAMIDEKIREYEDDDINENDHETLDSLYTLRQNAEEKYNELVDNLLTIYHNSEDLISNAKYDMGIYLNKLNDICGNGAIFNGNEYILVLDSRKYPETAEHIRVSMKLGKPNVLTVDRANAAIRRREALKHVKRNSNFDRDEYPCAMFKEGGANSHVFYLNKKDNRGSGAYICLRLRKLRNGTKVRIRII